VILVGGPTRGSIVMTVTLLAGACSSSNEPAVAPDSTAQTTVTSTTSAATTTTKVTATATTTATTAPTCAPELDGAGAIDTGASFDVDGDGESDVLRSVSTDDAHWVQLTRSSDGAHTTPTDIGRIAWWPTEVLDVADLDGNGDDELLINVGGNTALNGVIVDVEGCDTRVATQDGEPFWYLHGVGGNSCWPTGCVALITCDPTDRGPRLVVSLSERGPDVDTSTDEGHDYWDSVPTGEVPMRTVSHWYRFVDGQIEADGSEVNDALSGDVPRIGGVYCAVTIDGSPLAVSVP